MIHAQIDLPPMAVIIVTYRSEKVIGDCLDSLRASTHPQLRIVVIDNASPDGTVRAVRDWAGRNGRCLREQRRGGATGLTPPPHSVTLVHNGDNLGFAGGVNAGIRAAYDWDETDLFWILNPDCTVAPNAASAFARSALQSGSFALMGGRIRYSAGANRVQSDGGVVSRWTGRCRNLNQGGSVLRALPDPGTLDFISGASMVASRQFIDRAGPLPEDYFLYYEEVDWAARRGDLPLALCPDALVLHQGGTAIGSGTEDRLPSAFANYFNFRNRIRFMRRHNPAALPMAYAFSVLKILQILMKGDRERALGAWRGLNEMRPPASVAQSLPARDAPRAFGMRV